jgi:formate dehydrogenase maturation protein FdhE
VDEQQKAYLLSLFNQLSPGQKEQATAALEQIAAAVKAGDKDAFDAVIVGVIPDHGPQVTGPLWHMLRMQKASTA